MTVPVALVGLKLISLNSADITFKGNDVINP